MLAGYNLKAAKVFAGQQIEQILMLAGYSLKAVKVFAGQQIAQILMLAGYSLKAAKVLLSTNQRCHGLFYNTITLPYL